MTQEQLAEASNLTANFISLIENGRKPAGHKSLARIAKALDIPISFLSRHYDDETVKQSIDIIEDLADCSERELFIIHSTIKGLKNSLRIVNFS